MAFKNRVRLPIKLHKPQFPEETSEYRKANGVNKVLSVVIRKVYEGLTDELPEKLHERLKIALRHDSVIIEGDKYLGEITQEGDYTIDWVDFLDRPIAMAKFKANVTPFNASNNNCGTCEEYTQVICEDDNIGTIGENDSYDIEILANDSVCCFPIEITIVTFNATYVDSAVVNPDDTITLNIKNDLSSINSVVLATYRVQCESGMFDEANIIANIEGTNPDPVCLAPIGPLLVSLDSDTSATFAWNDPDPIPACDYHWEIRNIVNVVIASGDTPTSSVAVTGLPSNQTFLRFYVRSNCCDDFNSNYAGPVIFSLPPPSDTDTCGDYLLENQNFDNFYSVSYVDCNGDSQVVNIGPLHNRNICALQTSPGNPVEITPENSDVQILYQGLC